MSALATLSLLVVLTLTPAAASPGSPLGSGWGQAAPISAGPFGAGAPDLAMDASGNAIAVWVQYDGVRTSAYATTYSVAFGWATPTRIERSDAGDVSAAFVAMDPGGNGTAVWHAFDGTRFRTFGNRFTPGVGWGDAVGIDDPNLLDSAWPDVGADANGNAIAVFRQFDGATTSMFANRYVPGSGWSGAAVIEAYGASSDDVRIAVAPGGEATAVWRQWDGSVNSIAANRFTPGSGWGTAAYVEAAGGEAIEPHVATDASGAATAVWRQLTGSARSVYANRFTPGVGWGSPVLVETDDTGDAASPRVATDGAGNAVAVWSQSDGTTSNVWANRYVVGTGWGSPVALETASGFTTSTLVAVDGEGNAFATWLQIDGSVLNLYAARYRAGTGWGSPVLVEVDNQGGASTGGLSTDPAGHAIAVWPQSDGTLSRIWANRFVRDLVPPTLVVSSPADGTTNDPSLVIAGATEPGAVVTINGVSVTVASDGTFSATRTLVEGTNAFTIAATDDEGNADVVVRSVVLDTTPPALTLLTPADGATTSAPTVTVSGTTEAGATLVVNGIVVAVASDGTFSFELALHEGSNVVTANATDAAGNSRVVSLDVTYTNPLPALQTSLLNLMQELDDARADLAEVSDAVVTANDRLVSIANQNVLVTLLLAVLVAVVAVQSVLYWSLRRRMRGDGRGWEAAREPPKL